MTEELVSPVGAGQGSNWESFAALCAKLRMAPLGRPCFQTLCSGDFVAFRFQDDDTQLLEWVLCRVLKTIKSRTFTHLIEQYSSDGGGRRHTMQRNALLSKERYSLKGELGTFFLLAKDSIYEWKPAPTEQRVARQVDRKTGKKGKRCRQTEEGEVVSVATVSGGKTVYHVKYSGGDSEILDEERLGKKVSFYARLNGLVPAQGEEQKVEEEEEEGEEEKEDKEGVDEEEEETAALPPSGILPLPVLASAPRKSLSFAFYSDSDDDEDEGPTQPILTQQTMRKGPRPATGEKTVFRPILDDDSENELPLSSNPLLPFQKFS